jgi:hypothetical protein
MIQIVLIHVNKTYIQLGMAARCKLPKVMPPFLTGKIKQP